MAGNPNPLTPLRYPGGKSSFAPFIKTIFQSNNILGGHYLEPFAGGCGLALNLLLNNYCSHIHINDIDLAIYNFWKSILKNTDEFLSLLYKTPISIDEWHKQKYILNNFQKYSYLEHGFATFFLNRTNRSGILKAGVIGGKSQNGSYKLDARFNKDRLANIIKRISNYSDRIHIYNLDALILMSDIKNILPKKSLIYLDPPYYVKGHGLYRNFYLHEDHVNIYKTLSKIKDYHWIVSYDNCDQIKEIYSNYRKDEYFLSYCAYEKKKGSEIMIYGDSINIPEVNLLKK